MSRNPNYFVNMILIIILLGLDGLLNLIILSHLFHMITRQIFDTDDFRHFEILLFFIIIFLNIRHLKFSYGF